MGDDFFANENVRHCREFQRADGGTASVKCVCVCEPIVGERIIQFERCLISLLISSLVNLTASSCGARDLHSFGLFPLFCLLPHLIRVTILLEFIFIRAHADDLPHHSNYYFIYSWCVPHARASCLHTHKIADAKNAR